MKTENNRLEDYVRNLISRRDHLLAVNARLSLPYNCNQGSSSAGAQREKYPAGVQGEGNDVQSRGEVTPNHTESKMEDISDEDESPINVVVRS